MRYREMDANGDYQFMGFTPFLVDSPEAVAQAVLTRLQLYTKEWFLDSREGLDKDAILGYGTQGTRDQAIQQRVLGTPGVVRIVSYSSSVDETRLFNVDMVLDTIYGQVTITRTF